MAYRFKLDNNAGKGFRRIVREQISLAIGELEASDIPPNDIPTAHAIHASRKALKRLRALIACAEPAIGEKAARKHDRAVRDIGRALSARRDADVSLETVAALEERYGEDARVTLAPLRSRLEEARGEIVNGLDSASLAAIRKRLEKVGKALGKERWSGKGIKPVFAGIGRIYQAARLALKKAFKEPTDERVHEFRKLVQAHWRHMALVSRAWPEAFAVRVAAARDLSQVLGDDHDLAVLKLAAEELEDSERSAIVALCARRQSELRAFAEPLARRLFAETERAFVQRSSAYWRLAGKIKADEEGPEKAPINAPPSIGSQASIAAKTSI